MSSGNNGLDILALVLVYAAAVTGWAFVVGRRKLHAAPRLPAFFPLWIYPAFAAVLLWRAWVNDILGWPITVAIVLAGLAIAARLRFVMSIERDQEERLAGGSTR